MDHKNLHESIKSLEAMVNKLAIAIIVAALIIGSSMLVKFDMQIAQNVVSAIGIVGFIIAIIVAGIMLISHFKKTK